MWIMLGLGEMTVGKTILGCFVSSMTQLLAGISCVELIKLYGTKSRVMQEKLDKQYTRSLGCDNFNFIVVTVFYDFIRCY